MTNQNHHSQTKTAARRHYTSPESPSATQRLTLGEKALDHLCEQFLQGLSQRFYTLIPTVIGPLFVVYHPDGFLSEAASLYQRALTIREPTLGPDHARTIETRKRLDAVQAERSKREHDGH
jgi:hypothetical protein